MASDNVRVNAIAPSVTLTPRVRALMAGNDGTGEDGEVASARPGRTRGRGAGCACIWRPMNHASQQGTIIARRQRRDDRLTASKPPCPPLRADRLTGIASVLLEQAGAHRPVRPRRLLAIASTQIWSGHDSHGIIQIPSYIDRIKVGHIVPGAPMGRRAGITDDNGHRRALGLRLRRQRARDAASTIEKAETQNVAATTVFRQGHIGRLANYPLMAARRGMIAMITADSGRSPKHVAHHLEARRRGLARTRSASPCRPISMGPLFFDMATSAAAAAGKVMLAAARGEQVPAGLDHRRRRPSHHRSAQAEAGRRSFAVGRNGRLQGIWSGRDGGNLLRAADRIGVRRGADRAAQRRLLYGGVQGFRISPAGCLQARGAGIRRIPESHAPGDRLHRSAVSWRNRAPP